LIIIAMLAQKNFIDEPTEGKDFVAKKIYQII
jgi:hypothetical protein